MAYRVAAPAVTSAAFLIEFGYNARVTATSAAQDLPLCREGINMSPGRSLEFAISPGFSDLGVQPAI